MHKLLRCLASLALVFSLSCVSLTASAVDSSVYMPSGYGTKVWLPSMSVNFYDHSSKIGSASLTSGVTGVWQSFTESDTAQNIYRLSLATWSGNVPAGTVGFKVVRDDSSYLPFVTFQSVGFSGSNGQLSGSVTAYLGYGSSHSQYTKVLYPKEAELFILYDGESSSVSAGRVNTADGCATFSINVDRPVARIQIQFRWPDSEFPNEFPSPSVCWGLTYIDDLHWSKTGVTTGQQTVSGIQESNSLLSGLLSGVNKIFNSIIELPKTLGNMLKGLFIPDEEQMDILRGKWQVFLTTKMGFIYQMFQWVDTFFDGIIDNLTGEDTGAFQIPAFPAFEAGGETVQLWSEPLTVDFSDNAFVQTLQPIACPFILGVTAYHLWFAMSDLMECFFAGKSYRDYHEGRKEE